MFKKTIKFKNFNDEEVIKEFYFHMSKAELLEMAADGNAMMERIKRITETQDGRAILKEFREIIWASVGQRSEDGARFVKDDLAKRDLFESPAYDELLMELSTDAGAAAEFVRQLIPEKMQKEMQEQLAKQQTEVVDPFKEPAKDDPRPAWLKEGREPTQQELLAMSQEELVQAYQMRAANKRL